MIDEMGVRAFTNPNFVWLEKDAVQEILSRRKSGSSDALTVYNNLSALQYLARIKTLLEELKCTHRLSLMGLAGYKMKEWFFDMTII